MRTPNNISPSLSAYYDQEMNSCFLSTFFHLIPVINFKQFAQLQD